MQLWYTCDIEKGIQHVAISKYDAMQYCLITTGDTRKVPPFQRLQHNLYYYKIGTRTKVDSVSSYYLGTIEGFKSGNIDSMLHREISPIRGDIVCVSGSMKFFDSMLLVAKQLTFENKIVLLPYALKSQLTPELEDMLDKLHCKKIDISTDLLVVNEFGYIGTSTNNEISYACEKGIDITYLIEYP